EILHRYRKVLGVLGFHSGVEGVLKGLVFRHSVFLFLQLLFVLGPLLLGHPGLRLSLSRSWTSAWGCRGCRRVRSRHLGQIELERRIIARTRAHALHGTHV